MRTGGGHGLSVVHRHVYRVQSSVAVGLDFLQFLLGSGRSHSKVVVAAISSSCRVPETSVIVMLLV